MFCAVILENAANLVHKRNRDQIDEEENRPDDAVDHVVFEIAHCRHQVVPDQVCDAEGRENEDADTESKCGHRHRGKAGSFHQHAHSVAEVSPGRFTEAHAAHVTALLADALEVSKPLPRLSRHT